MKSKVIFIVLLLAGGVFGQLNKSYFKLNLPLDTAVFCKLKVLDTLKVGRVDSAQYKVVQYDQAWGRAWKILFGNAIVQSVVKYIDGTVLNLFSTDVGIGTLPDANEKLVVAGNLAISNNGDIVTRSGSAGNILGFDTIAADTFIAPCELWNECNLQFFVNGTIAPLIPFTPGAWEMYAQHIKGSYGACSIYQNIDYISAEKGDFDSCLIGNVKVNGSITINGGSALGVYLDTTFYDSIYDGGTYRSRSLSRIVQVGKAVTYYHRLKSGTASGGVYAIKGIPTKFNPINVGATGIQMPIYIVTDGGAAYQWGTLSFNSATGDYEIYTASGLYPSGATTILHSCVPWIAE